MEMLKPGNIGLEKDIEGSYYVYLGEYKDAQEKEAKHKRYVYIYLGSARYGMSVRLETEEDFAALNTRILQGVYSIEYLYTTESPLELKKIGVDHEIATGFPPYSRTIEDAVQRYGCKVFIPTHICGMVRV